MSKQCSQCTEAFAPSEQIMTCNGRQLHINCHVCVQCFRPFPNEVFLTYDGKNYCEEDYRELFGPKCSHCGEFIVGKCISALDGKWHPEHFTCSLCGISLAGGSFVKKDGKPMCRPCSNKKATVDEGDLCAKCRKPLAGDFIILQNQKMHPHHFNCHTCKSLLTATCKEYEGKLYCIKDYERARVSVCAGCRKPIEGRATSALGKQWHPEHFVCFKCEKPFSGASFFEYRGQPYCSPHYRQLVGERCFVCCLTISGESVDTMNKIWCLKHFSCGGCGVTLAKLGMKFLEADGRPFCKKCYEKLPTDTRKKLKKYCEMEDKIKKEAKKK